MAALTCISCISCIHEFPEPEFTEQENDQQGKTKVTFRVTNAFSTRSSVNVDDDIIRNINIYAYRDGKLEEKTYMTSPSVVIMELTKGVNYNIYAVANTGPLSPPVNETQLASFSCSIISIASLKNGIPMSWAQERVQINDNSRDISIALERLVSRIGFQVDASLLNGLKINSVQLKQSARIVRPFLNGGSYARTSTEVIDGDMATTMDIDDINNGFGVFFYAMENIQGNLLPRNQDPWSKVPDSVGGRAAVCTYLEVQCSFLSESIYDGTVTYRFFPGDNNINDFSIRRNTDMMIVMCPTGEGLREISWKVESNVTIRDGYAWGYIDEGRHTADDLYLGEEFYYYVEISDELTEHFSGDISGCTFEFVSEDGGDITFSNYSPSNEYHSIYAQGTCCGEGTGEIWLCDKSGNRVTPVGSDFYIQKPKMVLSFYSSVQVNDNYFEIDESPWCYINSGQERLHIYFTDNEGYNLNTDYWCGYDPSIFRFESNPYVESEFNIESTIDVKLTAGTANSDGPVAIYDITCTHDGTDDEINTNLLSALASYRAFYVDLDELNYGIGDSPSLYLEIPDITLTLVDNGWANYGNTQLALKVDNPSNLPLNITGWQVNGTNTSWNAIYRNSIIDKVENEMTLTGISYITSTYSESQLPIYGQSFSIYSDKGEFGDSYIEDGNLMVYNISGVNTNDIIMATSYNKCGQETLYHLIDVSMPNRRLYSYQVSLIDNLEDGSMTYSIIYGDDPENPGWNNQGMWLYSLGNLIKKNNTTLDTYANVTAQNLSSLVNRKISPGPYELTISYDSSAGQLYAKCTKGNLYGVKIDTYITGTVNGYVETFPNGTWGSGKDNNCTAKIYGGVTGVSVGSTNVSIDGGAIKAGMDAIYAQTFYDSHNWIGSSNSYQHSAHPTSMSVTLKIRVNSSSGTELYPITLTWSDTKVSYYHAQDGTTYSPTISKTMPLFNFVRVKRN